MSDFVPDFIPSYHPENPLITLADDLGLTYVDKPSRIYREQVPEGVPWSALPLLQQAEPDDLHDLMFGYFGGLPVQAFNLELMTYREEPSKTRRSCVLFHLTGEFPTLTVGPHSRLSLVQERDRSPFAQKYRVLGRDPEVAKLVLDDGMRHWLLGVSTPMHVELGEHFLLGHTAHLTPEVWPLLFQSVYGFWTRIPDAAWSHYSLR